MPERVLNDEVVDPRGREALRIVDPDRRECTDRAQYAGQNEQNESDRVDRGRGMAAEVGRHYGPTSRRRVAVAEGDDVLTAVSTHSHVGPVAQVDHRRVVEAGRGVCGFHGQQAHAQTLLTIDDWVKTLTETGRTISNLRKKSPTLTKLVTVFRVRYYNVRYSN